MGGAGGGVSGGWVGGRRRGESLLVSNILLVWVRSQVKESEAGRETLGLCERQKQIIEPSGTSWNHGGGQNAYNPFLYIFVSLYDIKLLTALVSEVCTEKCQGVNGGCSGRLLIGDLIPPLRTKAISSRSFKIPLPAPPWDTPHPQRAGQ